MVDSHFRRIRSNWRMISNSFNFKVLCIPMLLFVLYHCKGTQLQTNNEQNFNCPLKQGKNVECCPGVLTFRLICFKRKTPIALTYSEAVQKCTEKNFRPPQPAELQYALRRYIDSNELYWSAGKYVVGYQSGKIIRRRIKNNDARYKIRCVAYKKGHSGVNDFPFLPHPDFDSPNPGVNLKACKAHGFYCPLNVSD